METRIVIEVEGGIVQRVAVNAPISSLRIYVRDLDEESEEPVRVRELKPVVLPPTKFDKLLDESDLES